MKHTEKEIEQVLAEIREREDEVLYKKGWNEGYKAGHNDGNRAKFPTWERINMICMFITILGFIAIVTIPGWA